MGARALVAAVLVAALAGPALALEVVTLGSDEVTRGAVVRCDEHGGCDELVVCARNRRRAFLSVRDAWSHLRLDVESPSAARVCLVGESSDSRFRVETFRDGEDQAALVRRLNKRTGRSYGGLGAINELLESVALTSTCSRTLTTSPYGVTCVRLLSLDGSWPRDAALRVRKETMRLYYPRMLLMGLFVLSVAPVLADLVVFYYVVGVTVGVLLSVLVTSYFVLRRVAPERKGTVWLAVAFQAMFGAFAFVNDLLQRMLEENTNLVLGYLLVSGFVSFALTHWMLRDSSGAGSAGPSAGFKDIVRWGIQCAGYALVAWSSASVQWSVAIVLAVFTHRVLAPALGAGISSVLFWLNPNRDVAKMELRYLARPFLSEEEYQDEARDYTDKAQRELLSNRDFQSWILNNAGRIHVLPADAAEAEADAR